MEDNQTIEVNEDSAVEILIRIKPSVSKSATSEENRKVRESAERLQASEAQRQAIEAEKNNLAEELATAKKQLRTAEDRFEPVRDLVEIYERYARLPDHILSHFNGIIIAHTPVTFAMSLADPDRLKRFCNQLESIVANDADEIESAMSFTDELKTLAAVFNFFCDNCLAAMFKDEYSRQEAVVGSKFDGATSVRVGRRSGRIKDVLIQGCSLNGKSIAQSIVLVEDF